MHLIERNSCPLCGNQKFNYLYKISYNETDIKNFLLNYYNNKLNLNLILNSDYELLECNKCSFIFQKNIPNDRFSQHLYENIISANESFEKKNNLDKYKKKYEFEISLINSIFKKKNINVLEFGAGWGFWAKNAKANGINVDVFEVSRERIKFMEENHLNVVHDLTNINKTYDLIYSDQTIEHLNNPYDLFNSTLPILSQNGYLLINYPSTFMFKRKLKKNYIPKKDAAHPLEHLNLFNRSSFEFIAKKYNLELINFKCKYHLTFKAIIKDIKNFFYFDSILLKKN